MIARIALAAANFTIDRPYDYTVPEEFQDTLKPGMRVFVPFGVGNRVTEGIVLSLCEVSEYGECKEILRVADREVLLDPQLLQLAFFMRERYFCTVYQAARAMLPAGLWFDASGQQRGKDRFREMARLSISSQEALLLAESMSRRAPKQAEILELLAGFEVLPVQDLLHFTVASRAVLKRLQETGTVELFQQEIYRRPERGSVEPQALPALNAEQDAAFRSILADLFVGSVSPGNTASAGVPGLLFGVTGSGKTGIYAHLIDRCLQQGRSAILLVPEIALTPQVLLQFTAWFGDSVALLHSGLSMGERYDEWKRIRRGEANLVIGTRSAVFAPVRDLGLILLDEEQEESYRSESTPRYSTREVARYRCHQLGAGLLLGSATPDLRSRYLAQQGEYRLYRLEHRYNRKPLPDVHIVDMKQELQAGNRMLLSRSLKDAILDRMERGEQSILFLNRRGTNKLVCCSVCGYVYRCEHCSVSMTWHANVRRLVCHYCGAVRRLDQSCPSCGGSLSFTGAGTQMAEEELHNVFPEVPILRVDSDSVSPVGSHRVLFQRFREEKIPLMIGTQMVAKGLNFDNVTLVGVLSADQSLYANDFRAGERTFSLLTQVIGRGGRGDKPGEAFIQTFTPENEIIRLAAKQDYDAFYESELSMRRIQNAPPFYDWVRFSASGPDEARVIEALKLCRNMLEGSFAPQDSVSVLGPVPLPVVRVSDRFRYCLQICCRLDRGIRRMLASVLISAGRLPGTRGVSFYIDNESG